MTELTPARRVPLTVPVENLEHADFLGEGLLLPRDLVIEAPELSSDDLIEVSYRAYSAGQEKVVQGKIAGIFNLECARCAAPLRRRFTMRFRHYYAAGKGETALEDAEELYHYEGSRLDLRQGLREEVLLQIPMKPLCREDCQGLCEQCGQNLNEGSCSCAQEDIDPRLEILKQLLPKKETD
jgi:uncharacterized protein